MIARKNIRIATNPCPMRVREYCKTSEHTLDCMTPRAPKRKVDGSNPPEVTRNAVKSDFTAIFLCSELNLAVKLILYYLLSKMNISLIGLELFSKESSEYVRLPRVTLLCVLTAMRLIVAPVSLQSPVTHMVPYIHNFMTARLMQSAARKTGEGPGRPPHGRTCRSPT